MKYAVFSKWTWFWMLWAQVWGIYDLVVIWFDPNIRTAWWFFAIAITQPLFTVLYLVFARKRAGTMRLTRDGDTWRWRLV